MSGTNGDKVFQRPWLGVSELKKGVSEEELGKMKAPKEDPYPYPTVHEHYWQPAGGPQYHPWKDQNFLTVFCTCGEIQRRFFYPERLDREQHERVKLPKQPLDNG